MTSAFPLRGLRVLEFSHMIMGPSAAMILADLGATVTKIEPLDGDKTRALTGSGAGFFPAFNRNKRSLALDLKNPKAIDLVKRLTLRSDVVIENFRPGALDALGLGAEALRMLNPRLVYCSLKGFLSGPYERRTALDEVVQMMGGLAFMTGHTGKPLRAGASVNDIMGGMFGVIAILAALRERDGMSTGTGTGGIVKAGLFENNAFLMSQHMVQSAMTGTPTRPMPERQSAWAVYDVFRANDGNQFFLGVVSDTQWSAFCSAFGLTDLLDDPALDTNVHRVSNRMRFMPRLQALFASMDVGDILRMAEHSGLPCGPINSPDDLKTDPHLQHPGAMVSVVLPNGKRTNIPALPLEFDGKRVQLRRSIPDIGADSSEIAEEAGLTLEEIDDMIKDGALGAPNKLAAE